MDDEVTEHLVVPTKQENRLEGSCGGKGMPESETAEGKDAGATELSSTSTKRQRIAHEQRTHSSKSRMR